VRHNPALRALGFAPRDRVVVVHADDVGMCGATVDAFVELSERGVTSSGSAMVPCPGFPAVAARCGRRADVDLGVHLTLTSEWDGYRWGPISTRDRASGLLDEEGFFHRNQDDWPTVDRDALRHEIHAQLDRAIAAGLDVTHVDCHMFCALHPSVTSAYVELAFVRRVPVFMTRQWGWLQALGEPAIAGWEERGLPVFDDQVELPHDGDTATWMARAKRMFAELPAGLTYLIIHPAADTPELRAIVPWWRQRVADLETFRSDELVRHVRGLGVEVIGWRPLRELMRTTIGGGE
jgi:predicted glycoside hydrolase/deacetylase ChbG (UPF0249 family)